MHGWCALVATRGSCAALHLVRCLRLGPCLQVRRPRSRPHSSAAGGRADSDAIVARLAAEDVDGAYAAALAVLSEGCGASRRALATCARPWGDAFDASGPAPSQPDRLMSDAHGNIPAAIRSLLVRQPWGATGGGASAQLGPGRPLVEAHAAQGLLDTLLARARWSHASRFVVAYVAYLSSAAAGAEEAALPITAMNRSRRGPRAASLRGLSPPASRFLISFCDAACGSGGAAATGSAFLGMQNDAASGDVGQPSNVLVALSLPAELGRMLDREERSCLVRLGVLNSSASASKSPLAASAPGSVHGVYSDDGVREEHMSMFYDSGRRLNSDAQRSLEGDNVAQAEAAVSSSASSASESNATVVMLRPHEVADLTLRTLVLQLDLVPPHRAFRAALVAHLRAHEGERALGRNRFDGSGGGASGVAGPALADPPEPDEAAWDALDAAPQRQFGRLRSSWLRGLGLLQFLLNLHGNHASGWRRVRLWSRSDRKEGAFNGNEPEIARGRAFTAISLQHVGFGPGDTALSPLVSAFVSRAASGVLPAEALLPSLRMLRSSIVHAGILLDATLTRDVIRLLARCGQSASALTVYDAFHQLYASIFAIVSSSAPPDLAGVQRRDEFARLLKHAETAALSGSIGKVPRPVRLPSASLSASDCRALAAALLVAESRAGDIGAAESGEGGTGSVAQSDESAHAVSVSMKRTAPTASFPPSIDGGRIEFSMEDFIAAHFGAASPAPALSGASSTRMNPLPLSALRPHRSAVEASRQFSSQKEAVSIASLASVGHIPIVFDAAAVALSVARRGASRLAQDKESGSSGSAVAGGSNEYVQVVDAAFRAAADAAMRAGVSASLDALPQSGTVSLAAAPTPLSSNRWLATATSALERLAHVGERVDSRLAEAVLRVSATHGPPAQAIAMMSSLLDAGVAVTLPAITSVVAGFRSSRSPGAAREAQRLVEAVLRAAGWVESPMLSSRASASNLRSLGDAWARRVRQTSPFSAPPAKTAWQAILSRFVSGLADVSAAACAAAQADNAKGGIVFIHPSTFDSVDGKAVVAEDSARKVSSSQSSSVTASREGHKRSTSGAGSRMFDLDARALLSLSRVLLEDGRRLGAGLLLLHLLREPQLLEQLGGSVKRGDDSTPWRISADSFAQISDLCARIVGIERAADLVHSMLALSAAGTEAANVLPEAANAAVKLPDDFGTTRASAARARRSSSDLFRIALDERVHLSVMRMCARLLQSRYDAGRALALAEYVHSALLAQGARGNRGIRSESFDDDAVERRDTSPASPAAFEAFLSVAAAAVPHAIAQHSFEDASYWPSPIVRGAGRMNGGGDAQLDAFWQQLNADICEDALDADSSSVRGAGRSPNRAASLVGEPSASVGNSILDYTRTAIAMMIRFQVPPTALSVHRILAIFAAQHEFGAIAASTAPCLSASGDEAALSPILLQSAATFESAIAKFAALPQPELSSAASRRTRVAMGLAACLKNASAAAARARSAGITPPPLALPAPLGPSARAHAWHPQHDFPTDLMSPFHASVHRLVGDLDLGSEDRRWRLLYSLQSQPV